MTTEAKIIKTVIENVQDAGSKDTAQIMRELNNVYRQEDLDAFMSMSLFDLLHRIKVSDLFEMK
jgi:hypothetical protein